MDTHDLFFSLAQQHIANRFYRACRNARIYGCCRPLRGVKRQRTSDSDELFDSFAVRLAALHDHR